ncbi:hypothetical protein [Oryzomonas rubra]|uniref:Uracil DNA glycosylase superfamily protein n=1 Tax=Oryzomonas rubra TaxID=2509454 RepID=A0A5A9XNP6_9BACT|nr:hypothetical protein [Oryzomonas rubra]KAA0894213.1 hypothetical protein ET418_04460 [Oryzomonas rubra]
MATTQTIDQINAELMEIWDNSFEPNSGAFLPMQYMEPKKGALVFVGLNPSFSAKGMGSLQRKITGPNFDNKTFFSWPSPLDFDIELAQNLEVLARDNYSFFEPHRTLARVLNLQWEHFDLFAYRETQQEKTKKQILVSTDNVKLNAFGQRQFDVFNTLLQLAQPAAVVVINALASQIYLNQRKTIFISEKGHYQDCTNEPGFPVFFSGMITGARALDRYSRERLYWQIGKVFGKEWHPSSQPPIVSVGD